MKPNKSIRTVDCRTCGGEGTVSAMAPVFAGEPHIASVGTEDCPDCLNQ